jgi:hypothetical protein
MTALVFSVLSVLLIALGIFVIVYNNEAMLGSIILGTAAVFAINALQYSKYRSRVVVSIDEDAHMLFFFEVALSKLPSSQLNYYGIREFAIEDGMLQLYNNDHSRSKIVSLEDIEPIDILYIRTLLIKECDRTRLGLNPIEEEWEPLT